MNAPSEEQADVEANPAPGPADKSWLRNSLLAATLLLLAVLALKAREMTGEILAAIEPVAEWFNLPF